jgi:type I site-specific restriction endonuclease
LGSNDPDDKRLAAEHRARVLIDGQLTAAGWAVQDKKQLNLFANQGIACREVVMAPGHGRADYLLYVDQKVVGVIEAKPVGTSLSGVEWQSAMYAEGLPTEVRLKALTVDSRLPFVFEASGPECGSPTDSTRTLGRGASLMSRSRRIGRAVVAGSGAGTADAIASLTDMRLVGLTAGSTRLHFSHGVLRLVRRCAVT